MSSKDLSNSGSKQDQKNSAAKLLAPDNFSLKMIREYISWIGLFSTSKPGLEMLAQFKIFE